MRKYLATAFFAASNLGFGHAAILASQTFEGNSFATGTTGNTGFPSGSGLTFDGSGTPWSVSFLDTLGTGLAGPISGAGDVEDLIGVVDAGVTAGTAGAGTNELTGAAGADGAYFLVDDADGTVSLDFAPIDAGGFSDLTLAFTWATAVTEYEEGDLFAITVNGTSVFSIGGAPLGGGPFLNNFVGPALDISAFDGQILLISIIFSNDDGGEDIGFDNFFVEGTPEAVPIPMAAFLFAPAAAMFLRRRR